MHDDPPPRSLCLLIGRLPAGGAERVLTTLANRWAAAGTRVTLLTFDRPHDPPPFYPLHPAVRHRRLAIDGHHRGLVARVRATLHRLGTIRRAVRRSRCEATIAFMDRTNILAVVALLGTGMPLLISQRVDPRRHPIGRAWSALRRCSYRLADGLVVQTRAVARELAAIGPARCAIIPNPLPDWVDAERNVAQRERIVLGVGRLEPQKGFDLLIDAFATIAPRHEEWSLRIVGTGSEREALMARAASTEVADRITIDPPTVDIAPIYRSAGVFVLASRYEGYPNALCEAMALGCPVIATDCDSGPAEILSPERDGLLVPAADPEALATALDRLLGDDELRRSLGRHATRIRSRLAGGDILRRWNRLLASLIAPRAGPTVPSGMAVDMLIPTRGRDPGELAPALRAAARQAPVLVCDQNTPALQPIPDCRLLHCPHLSGLPAARNQLLRASDAEWVVFLDDDAEPAADFVAHLTELVAARPAVVAWGPVVESRPRWLRRAHRLLQLGALRDPRRLTWGPADLPTRALFGCCFAVRREAAVACGGFDASRRGYALGEDLDFFLRLRGEKRFAHSLRCVHRESASGRADPFIRGQAKAACLRWIARRHGAHNPATVLHLILALAAAAAAGTRARERASLRGLLRGWCGPDPFANTR